MKKDTVVSLRQPEGQDLLSSMLREGAQRLIGEALQAEFEEFLSRFGQTRDEFGRAAVMRNGFHPQPEILTGLAPVGVQVPKARSRTEEAAVFCSSLVPPIARRRRWNPMQRTSPSDMPRQMSLGHVPAWRNSSAVAAP